MRGEPYASGGVQGDPLSERVPAARVLFLVAALGVLLYAASAASQPLNANDLFWHLAAGREILEKDSIPRSDPFSFASEGERWIDHEWLWQVAAQAVYAAFSGGGGPLPDPRGSLALILAGATVVVAAFAVVVIRLGAEGVPPGLVAVLGLLSVAVARERLMMRPETASLLFLALLLALLARGPAGWRRGLLIGVIVVIWANVHPAALIAPAVILAHAVAAMPGLGRAGDGRPHGQSRLDGTRDRREMEGEEAVEIAGADEAPASATAAPAGDERGSAWRGGAGEALAAGLGTRSLGRGRAVRAQSSWLVVEAALAALATLANPYGPSLWKVPFHLATLVKTEAFYNPEWLRPPLARFPLFYVAAAVLIAGAAAAIARTRRLPPGALIVALGLAVLAGRQMRHMGLFAVAFLHASGPLIRCAGLGQRQWGAARRPLATIAGSAACIAAAAVTLASGWAGAFADDAESARRGLDSRRFPILACEQIDTNLPGERLYNDVAFGGYLIWRFFPERKVFIDGRNELYGNLLQRLGRIHGSDAYNDWRALIREHRIEGAIVRYKEGKKGVIYPPRVPGAEPTRGYRSWSAFLFPVTEWALVYFDDTALVFVRRGGPGDTWARKGEFRILNPEDGDYLVERAGQDPLFASRLRMEIERRLSERGWPPCRRVEEIARRLVPQS